jgi:hypothetical protein
MTKVINLTDHKKNSNNTMQPDWNEWHKAICVGYAIMAAENAGFTKEQIRLLVLKLYDVQMYTAKIEPPEEAERAYMQWLKSYAGSGTHDQDHNDY